MKSDIDALMQERGLDAILIAGGEGYSEVRDYMSNGAHITGGYIVKKTGAEPMLFVSGMETEEAKKSGYAVTGWNELGFSDLFQNNDIDTATILFWEKCLVAADVPSGKIGLYGRGDLNTYVTLFALANEKLANYQFVGETGRTLFDEAFLTKDEQEIERIQSVAARTNEVMSATWDFIASHQADADENVVNDAGEALTIGQVKRFVLSQLMERGLEDTGMIFAQGRDAGFPHSRGEADQGLKLGQSIVFDLFPREFGGGYHHDMTRTWSIGYATPEVQAAYDDVMTAFDKSLEDFAVGKPTHSMQEAVLDYFESQGHPTGRSDSSANKGYVHSLGHGVGLMIHERPSISHIRRDDSWQIGNVVTIEPGLYYPDDGFGIRIEDLFIITESGELISLTPFKKDLVLPLTGQ
ncbi:MAG: M24 family metallopeptidase [Phototrophicaceae bacterium]